MTLTNTMLQVKKDIKDMQNYLNKNCISKDAYLHLMNVVSSIEDQLLEIDLHIVKGEFSKALIKIAEHAYPRKKDFYIRRNYDYGEFWPTVLDEFRAGKIKDVVEMSRKLRRWPEKDKKEKKQTKSEKELDTKVINPDMDRKKLVQRASEESLIPLDSYCGNKKNKEYWSKMKDLEEDYNQAIEDFLKYIEESKC